MRLRLLSDFIFIKKCSSLRCKRLEQSNVGIFDKTSTRAVRATIQSCELITKTVAPFALPEIKSSCVCLLSPRTTARRHGHVSRVTGPARP